LAISFQLLAGDLAHLGGVGGAGAFFNTYGLPDEHRRGGVFITKVKLRSEYTVMTTGIGRPFSVFWVCAFELLAELHDVHALLTQRRPDGRRGVGRACRHLQLDVTLYFLGHEYLSSGPDAAPAPCRM